MGIDGDVPLADAAAAIGAVEYRQMFGFEMWRTFDGHGAAAIIVGRGDFLLCEAERLQHVEIGLGQLKVGQPEFGTAELFPQHVLIKGKLDFERLRQTAFHSAKRGIVKPLLLQRLVIDERRALQSLAAHTIVDDILHL